MLVILLDKERYPPVVGSDIWLYLKKALLIKVNF